MMIVQMPNKRKLNNKGASVVELLIIMAIMAVLLSGSIIAFTILNSSNLKQATRTTQDYIEKTRAKAMSVVADEWSFVLTKDEDGFVVVVYKVYTEGDDVITEKVEEKTLGSRVSVCLLNGDDEVEISATNQLKVTFNPSSGSVDKVTVGTEEYGTTDNMISLKYESGKKKNTLDLYFVAGNVEIN